MLYNFEKYKVLQGTKSNLALCTCWMDPNSLKNDLDKIKSKFALTGTLYSKEGVSIILRNLALNPHIRYLFVWSNSPLSNTPFGRAGRDLLLNIFTDTSDLSEIHKEIDSEVINIIIKNVEIIHLVDSSIEEVLNANYGYYKNDDEYMSPVEFDEPKRDESQALPSEKVGFLTRSNTIYGSWLNAIDRIIRYAPLKKTEYGNNMRELHQINWVITNENPDHIYLPDLDEKVKGIIGLNDDSLKQYKLSLLDPIVPSGTAYTYGSRLRNYLDEFDQVNFFIEKLKDCPVSRRIVGTTLIPLKDSGASSPPCLTQIQVLADENNALTLFASFRSHDMFKAAIPNAYGLLHLQKYICEKANLKRGPISITSISAHIYEEDFDNAKKLLDCQKWTDVHLRFNEHTDQEHRGNVKIYLSDNKIHLEIIDELGGVLYHDSGINGIDIIMKITKLELLSKLDHIAQITYELTKADISLQNNLEFSQDKPLNLGKIKLIAG